jgi:hypothetical protein
MALVAKAQGGTSMFVSKQKIAMLSAVGALVLGVPAVSSAAIGLPGFGGSSANASASVSVGSVTGSNVGVLGPDGPLGKNGPLHGQGCLASGVNPNSLGPDGPLGPHGPLGLGGSGANLNCSSNSGGLFGNPFFSLNPFGFLNG